MSRQLVRTLCVVVLTAIAVTINGSDIALPWHPYGWFGLVPQNGSTVREVAPFAARAGVRPGDTIDLRKMTPADRYSVVKPVVPGRVMKLPLTSGKVVTIVAEPFRRSVADNVTNVIEVLTTFAYIFIAAMLVLLRPAPATWAFYVFSYNFCIFAATPNTWPFAVVVAWTVLMAVATAVAPAAFVSFALRFPDDEPKAAFRGLERFLLFIATPLLVLASLTGLYAQLFAGAAPRSLAGVIYYAIYDVIFVVGIVVLIARYFTANVVERNRLRWVVAAFAVAYLPFLLWDVALGSAWTAVLMSPAVINLSQAWYVLAPIALAYTVLRHRLFDIRFVVSRALMYAVLMAVVVGTIALIHWAFGRWLAESRFALVGELALALLVGAGLTAVHRTIEGFIDGVVFRSQKTALAALRRFAQEVDLIPDPQRLISQTHEALESRLECAYVAIYTADGSSYVLASTHAGESPPLLPADDFSVLRLRRWHESYESDDPRHAFRGAFLAPMTVRGELVGFIVCGPKRDRTHYLPEECDTLVMLTHRVGSAFAWLTMRPSVAAVMPL